MGDPNSLCGPWTGEPARPCCSARVWLPSDGSSTEPEPLLEGPNRYYPSAWVPQRNELIFGQDTPAGQTRWDLLRLDADGQVAVVVQNRGEDAEAQISPNGRFIAYETLVTERREIWVRAYPTGAPIRISSSGGDDPRWSHDGAELFFVEDASLNGGRMMVAAVDTDGDFRFDTPELLFEDSYDFGENFPYVVLPDGDFIVQDASFDAIDLEVEAGSILGDHLVAIVGLGDELRRIAPRE